MARPGVTETDVHTAADALLAAGERPTAERVRLALGRGSPNTIGPLLDSWWHGLSARLRHMQSLPAIPDEVGSAFAEAWSLAVAAGLAHAEAQVAPERAALAEALARTDAAAAGQQAALDALAIQLQQAQVTTRVLETTLGESQQRVADLKAELATLGASHTSLAQQRDVLDQRLLAAAVDAQTERTAATAERDRLQALLRQVEDRAYTEVDRSRQELKALKAQFATQAREHASALRASEEVRRTAETEAKRAEREAAALRGRLEALAARKAVKKARKGVARPASARPKV